MTRNDGSVAGTGGTEEAAMAERRIGYVPGVFDMFHIGHLNVLKNAGEHCDYLIAGVVSDEMAQRVKGLQPVVPTDERVAIVGACKYVDEAVVEDTAHKLEMWERVRFNVIVKGDDWKGTDRGDKLEQDFAAVGVEVVYVPYTTQTSSSLLRRVLMREIDGL